MTRAVPYGVATLLVLLMALVTACGDGKPPSARPLDATAEEDGAAIQFQICVDNTTWTRPPLEEHRAHLKADPRYPVDAELLAWYDAHFIRDIGSADEDIKYDWAGLWNDTASFDLEGPCAQPAGVVNPVAAREIVELWFLNYEALAVRAEGSGLAVEVRPREPGYQVIHFPNPMQEEGTAWGLIRFVDEQGEEIARIGSEEMQQHIGRATEAPPAP